MSHLAEYVAVQLFHSSNQYPHGLLPGSGTVPCFILVGRVIEFPVPPSLTCSKVTHADANPLWFPVPVAAESVTWRPGDPLTATWL